MLVDEKNPKRLIVGAWVVGQPTDGGIFISEDYGKNWYSQAEMRGQSVRSLTRSLSNPQILVAGTLRGVYRSMDNGMHWTAISPSDNTEIHEVESVAIDPSNPDVIYAGTWHLPWKTTDGGASWHSIKAGIIDDSDVFSIIVDPEKPNVVYASACSGIYKSTNGGTGFEKVQGIPSAARRTRMLGQDPEQLNTVFAGTTEGLYRTLDAGTDWERMTPADVIVNDVYVDPKDSKHVLIATDRGGVLRSEDGGTSFVASNSGFSSRQVRAYAQDALHPDVLYIGLVNDKATGGVFASNDGAVHWQQQSDGLDGRDVFSLLSLPDGTLLAGTIHGIFRYEEGKWVNSGLVAREPKPTHARVEVPASPKSSAKSVAVHASGLRPTAKVRQIAGRRFNLKRQSPHTAGYSRVVHHGATPAHKPRVLRVGAQTSGTGHRPAAAPQPARAARATTPHEAPSISTARPQADHIAATVLAMVSQGPTSFAGTGQGLLRSTDNGQHWDEVKELKLDEVSYLAASPAAVDSGGSGALLAANLDTAAFSLDGGTNWQALTLPRGLSEIGAVGIDGEQHFWIGGREGIWYSTDQGASWKTLRNLFVTQVDSLFYDAPHKRMLVTSETSPAAFSVQLPEDKVTYMNTGWRLRFARPVGDHLVAATLFDGMVIQPEMVATPLSTTEKVPQ